MFKLIISLSMLICTAMTVAADKKSPNVIVILCDDLGLGDIEGFGYNEVPTKTPELSKMANEGAKLSYFLVTAPYCAPSRASILTGRYPFRNGIVFNSTLVA